jgi:hypothetical protein
MGVPIRDFDDFKSAYDQRRDRSRLYGFLMFDDRPSHQAVASFARQQFPWLDELATSADMFFFVFGATDDAIGQVNPSLEVAKLFGLGPADLPGVLIFTSFRATGEVNRGCYLPLKASLFAEDMAGVEKALVSLFTLFQDVQREVSDDDLLLSALDQRMKGLRTSTRLRPMVTLVGGGLKSLTTLPKELLTSMATAFGAAAAKHFD